MWANMDYYALYIEDIIHKIDQSISTYFFLNSGALWESVKALDHLQRHKIGVKIHI